MRSFVPLLLVLLLFERPGYAQTLAPSPQEQYQRQKKSPGLALTLEAVSPIAGMGGFYAGDTDKAAFLAVLSGVAGGVGTGSVFWLIHLNNQNPSGVGRVTAQVEQSAAISLLVSSAVVYLLARVSGFAVASEATTTFNLDLQQQLGLTPSGELR